MNRLGVVLGILLCLGTVIGLNSLRDPCASARERLEKNKSAERTYEREGLLTLSRQIQFTRVQNELEVKVYDACKDE